jgi:putative endonuclease
VDRTITRVEGHVPFFTYILLCSDETLYVGSTANLAERLIRHNDGRGCQYTACRLPVRLVYSEEHPTLAAAIARERQVKRWSGVKKRALAEGRLGDLERFAQRRRR